MKIRLLIAMLASASCALGTYTYDFSAVPIPYTSTWSGNGTYDYGGSPTMVYFDTPGSLIYIPTVSGTNSNDYEVSSVMANWSGSFVHYLRASSDALGTLSSCAGSYVSVTFSYATLTVTRCNSGTLSTLGSTAITAISVGSTVRSIIWNTTLWVFVNNQLVYQNTSIPLTYGQPGIGGDADGACYTAMVGHHDVVAPAAPNPTSMRSSILPNSASLAWDGVADDSIGVGVYRYNVSRGGTPLTYISGTPLLDDSTVVPATSYTYSVSAVDYHGNVSAATSFTITTPPASAVDPRRTGIYTTGSYWGGGGEQIDTLSGNLNFSLPLVKPMGRTGNTVPIGLSYNSQNWRQDGGVNWQLGADVGYGYGWTLQIGSITPYYAGWTSGVDHYVFTDGTGAQYRLDQNSGGVWSSTQGIYLWFEASANKLHFKDGSFWVMGSTSGGGEQDAGTMYPTIISDVIGNQIIVTYKSAPTLPAAVTNSSARISTIEDVRAADLGGYPVAQYTTYAFSYNTDAIPHLTGIVNYIGSSETYSSFGYASASLGPPFGYDASYSGLTTTHLTNFTLPASGEYSFTYDSAGAAELTQVTLPQGGHLRWAYANGQYSGSRQLREIGTRYLAADSAGAVEWTYPFSHTDTGSIVTVHTDTTLVDASGVGAKTWTFVNPDGGTNPAWKTGLISQYIRSASLTGTVMTRDTYTWSQNSGSNPYISMKVSVLDETSTNAQSATTTQTQDQYGNTTESVIYPYNNTTTPLKTYDSTFDTDTAYVSHYVRNRLLTVKLTMGSTVKNLVQNYYDSAGYNGLPSASPCNSETLYPPPSPREVSATGFSPGLVTQSVTLPGSSLATSVCRHYNSLGTFADGTSSDGSTVTATLDSSTNYTAPTAIATESYNYSLGYNAWLGLASTTGANGEQSSTGYDSYGRPQASYTPFSSGGIYGVEWYSYSAAGVLPQWQKKIGGDGITTTILDGLGHPLQVQHSDGSGVLQSYTDMVYTPCACSPLSKLQKTSQPYPSGGTPVWTTYTYDGLGRTLSVQQPDGASTTTYSYSGNQTTVTDPAGNWKTFTNDVLGNLVTVIEPDPSTSGGTLNTYYTYDWMNHVACVDMTRGGIAATLYTYTSGGVTCQTGYSGGTRQTRTFVYSDAGLLTSATNPESGTVTYTYNGQNLPATKHDANGQDTGYGYDSARHVVSISRSSGGVVDPCQAVSYYYGTNPSDFSDQRLISVTYGTTGQVCVPGTLPTSYFETYSYNYAGAVATKTSGIWRNWASGYYAPGTTYPVTYRYDAWGHVTDLKYQGSDPFRSSPWYPGILHFSYTYDSMGRPSGMKDTDTYSTAPVWIQNVAYDYAGRMTSMQYPEFSASSVTYMTEAKTYNVIGQMSQTTWTQGGSSSAAPAGSVQYIYSSTQNNGQIAQAVDAVSGETITYQYDSLKRLTSASSSPITGTTIPVNSATNRLTSSYDANGNMLSGYGLTMTYDEANRLVSAAPASGGTEYYSYSPDNKRIYKKDAYGNEEWTMYGARGEKLGTLVWGLSCPDGIDDDCVLAPSITTTSVWFGGKLLWSGTGAAGTSGPVFADRLGTNRLNGARHRPYGEEITSTASGHEKFATYTRDSFTALDYADQRYYASSYGRFNTADTAAPNVKDPGTWNRFAYVAGDPINRNDPRGTCYIDRQSGQSYSDQEAEGLLYQGLLDADLAWSYGTCAISDPCYSAANSGSCSGGSGNQPAPAEPGGGGGNLSGPKAGNQYQAAAILGQELANLTPHCEEVLPVGLLDKKAGDLSFWDVRINGTVSLSAIGAANVQLSNGKFATTIGAAWIYPSAAAVTLAAAGGGLSNNIVLGSYFFDNQTTGEQGITLLHELLHYSTGLGDQNFDTAYGITGSAGQSASAALTSWLTNDCHNK